MTRRKGESDNELGTKCAPFGPDTFIPLFCDGYGMMTELAFSDPCILFALGRESRDFRREFRRQQRFPGAPCRARFHGPSWLSVLLLETGVGAEHTQRALDWLFAPPVMEGVPYRPQLVLAAGFAGALKADLRVGDVVLASEVVDSTGKGYATTWPEELPAGPWQPSLHQGRLLTMPRLVATPVEKLRLAEEHGALAVDMESAVIAAACSKRAIPFGCVRVISDDATTSLSPRLVELLSRCRVSPWRFAGAFMRSPALLLEMMRLARHTRFAAKQLGLALGELLTLTLAWTKDQSVSEVP